MKELEIVTPKVYHDTIEATQESLAKIVTSQVKDIEPVVTVLLRKRNGAKEYAVMAIEADMPDGRRERKAAFYKLGRKLADVKGYIPVAVILVAEAWGALVPDDKGGVSEALSEKAVKDIPGAKEIVMLSALKIDGTGDLYSYPISRNEDGVLSLTEPQHLEIDRLDQVGMLSHFFVGVADEVVPED